MFLFAAGNVVGPIRKIPSQFSATPGRYIPGRAVTRREVERNQKILHTIYSESGGALFDCSWRRLGTRFFALFPNQ